MKILTSILNFSSITLISRVLGLLRDWLLARFFGAGGEMDAFLIAFKIPNFFRRLFAEGAFSQVFVPILIANKKQLSTENSTVPDTNRPNSDNASTENYSTMSSNLSTIQKELIAGISMRLFGVVFVFCTIGIIIAPVYIFVFAPGFIGDATQVELTADLLRLTFPYLLFITMVAFLTALLNSSGFFSIGAMAPILLNVCLIIATIYWREYFARPIIALGVGVLVGGLVQWLVLAVASYRKGLLILPRWHVSPQATQQIKKMWCLLLPAMLSVSVIQINLLVDMLLASTLPAGSISWLYYGQRLMELPNGLFAVAIGTVVLPTFSHLIHDTSRENFSQHVDRAALLGTIITIPATLGLILLATPIISLLFQGGEFNLTDTKNSAEALWAYALSLPAFMLIKIYSPTFFAHRDTKTPLYCAIVAVVINISVSLLLIDSFAHLGLALATSASAWSNALLLYLFLLKQKKVILFRAIGDLSKILIVNVLFAVILYHTHNWLISTWFDWSKTQQLLNLSGIIGLSVIIYVLLCLIFRLNFQQWIKWQT